MNFEDLKLSPALLRAIAAENYTEPTPIQAQAIPIVLEGRDLLGCAQTGTGKTAAFALPILHRLSQNKPQPQPGQRQKSFIRALILSPTRELTGQIGDSFAAYGKHTGLRHTVIYGGVSQGPQVQALRNGVDILVATPGRLMDLMGQGHIDLRHVEVFVLDEADRMLDMGFINDIRKVIAKLPNTYQTLFFSATMPTDIQKLANEILKHPARVEVTPVSSTTEQIEQQVYMVEKPNKRALLLHLINTTRMGRVLVFTRSKARADMLVRYLNNNKIQTEAIHSDKSQNARQRALNNFRAGKTCVLVATDIASRGLDVDGISHVFNFDLPNEPETYVHRIGRTGRAGATGIAIALCDMEEIFYLSDIEMLIGQQIPVISGHPYDITFPSRPPVRPPERQSIQSFRSKNPNERKPGKGGHSLQSMARKKRRSNSKSAQPAV